jgi:hypothetical protein
VDHIEELLAGLDIGGRAGKMGLYVILYDFAQQAIHRSATARNTLQHIGATDFLLQRTLNGLDLTSNASDPVQQLGFFTDRVTHCKRLTIFD